MVSDPLFESVKELMDKSNKKEFHTMKNSIKCITLLLKRERSVSCMRADSISADPSCLEGMLWLKQETSALGSIVKKSSHGIASLPTFAMHSSARHRQEAPIWKDYHFSIKYVQTFRRCFG